MSARLRQSVANYERELKALDLQIANTEKSLANLREKKTQTAEARAFLDQHLSSLPKPPTPAAPAKQP